MKVYERFLGYGFEGFPFFLALVTIAMFQNRFPKLLAFLIVFLLVFAVFYLIYRIKREISYVLAFFLMIIISLVAWKIGFSPVIAVLLSSACCWRSMTYLFVYSRSQDGVDSIKIALVSIFYALFLTVTVPLYAYHKFIFIIVFLQLVYLFGMKMIQRSSEFVPAEQTVRPVFLRWASAGLVAVLFLGFLLSLIYALVKNIASAGLGFVLKGVLTVFAYPFYLLFKSFHIGGTFWKHLHNTNSANGKHKKPPLSSHNAASHFPHWILYAFLIAVGIAILWYLIRKTKPIAAREEEKAAISEEGVTFESETVSGKKKRRIKPPDDEVRKLFFQMQGVLHSCGFGRRQSEPVNDWFRRIQLNAGSMADVATGYRKVRYGEEALSESEKKNYRKAVDQLIREAKENKKQD